MKRSRGGIRDNAQGKISTCLVFIVEFRSPQYLCGKPEVDKQRGCCVRVCLCMCELRVVYFSHSWHETKQEETYGDWWTQEKSVTCQYLYCTDEDVLLSCALSSKIISMYTSAIVYG